MNLNLRLLLSCLLSLGWLTSAAQLTIVKDNIACAYGLKNAEGKWEVQAQYTLLEATSSGHFIFTQGLQKGLLSPLGKELIPAKYDGFRELTSGYPNIWQVTIDHKFGVVNSKDKLLYPTKYTRIKPDAGGNLLFYWYDDKTYYSLYGDTTGKILIPERKQMIGPFQGRSWAMIGGSAGGDEASFSAGVINLKGEEIIPPIYDRINYCHARQCFSVKKGAKIGLLRLNGNEMLPLKYDFPAQNDIRRPLPCFFDSQILLISENGKQGLMQGQGKLLVPPQFDEVIPKLGQDLPNYKYLIRQDGKYGTLNKQGKQVIPVEYDTLIPIYLRVRQRYSQDKIVNFHYIVQKEGRYGILDENGKEEVVPQWEGMFRSELDRQSVVYLTQGTEAQMVTLADSGLKTYPARYIATYDSVKIYQANGYFIPFVVTPEAPNKLQGRPTDFYRYKKTGVLTAIQLWRTTFILNEKGEMWGAGKIRDVRFQGNTHLQIGTKKGRWGILDPETGGLLVDTLYEAFSGSPFTGNGIWVREKSEAPSRSNCGGWVCLDNKGQPRSSHRFDQPFRETQTGIASSDGKLGIFNPESFQWELAPHFARMVKVHPEVWWVSTISGKHGLLNKDYSLLADTVYDAVDEVFASEYFNAYNNRNPIGITWWQLTRGGKNSLISNKGERITNQNTLTQRWFNYAFNVDSAQTPNKCNHCLKVRIPSKFEAPLTPSPLRKHLFDTLTHLYQDYRTCHRANYQNNCAKAISVPCETHRSHYYRLKWWGESTYTLCNRYFIPQSDDLGQPGSDLIINDYINVVLKNGKPTVIDWMDVFGTQANLQREVVHAIQSRDDLVLDCSSPEGLVRNLGRYFYFAEEGVWIQLEHGTNTGNPIPLLVPKERLQQISSANWIWENF